MAQRKRRISRKKNTKRKSSLSANVARLCGLMILFLVLVFSVCAAGYVIFLRTVFAQEILPDNGTEIVFEEPDPPQHEESGGDEREKRKVDLPKVAIIFDDMGHHELLGEKLLAFSFELNYSFLPFAPYTRKLENLAYLTGKTILLHLPLQPKSTRWSPGPGAIFIDDEPEVQKAKFYKCLEKTPHATGVNNHMGSLYTEDHAAMTRLIHEIGSRSLFFVDSYTTSGSVGLSIAQDLEVKSARRDIFLDNVLSEERICGQLEKLVNVAEKQGWGIGIAHPHHITVKAISTCGEMFTERVQYVSVKDVLE
jgi:polysaccharide deacetylase 2 family uncharacterized protein YibQ